jgi:hypothetical protein
MKLYTEEQVRQMIEKSRETGLTAEYFILTTTPIEPPSDEEIYIEAQNKRDNIKKLPFDSVSFQFGAIWLKDKIQGGNNEQQ